MVIFNNVKNDEKKCDNELNSAKGYKNVNDKTKNLKKYIKNLHFYIAKYRKNVYNSESDNSQIIQYSNI